MANNTYMPKGLPLLSDATLFKMMGEYRKSYSGLAHSVFPSAARLRKEIGLAMLAIERELDDRGISSAPTMKLTMNDVSSFLVQESVESFAQQARLTA